MYFFFSDAQCLSPTPDDNSVIERSLLLRKQWWVLELVEQEPFPAAFRSRARAQSARHAARVTRFSVNSSFDSLPPRTRDVVGMVPPPLQHIKQLFPKGTWKDNSYYPLLPSLKGLCIEWKMD